mmetsp:Transcript_50915/g.75489  ORF Transcript_50915/g.75489 Transcript_50915/m.75489 type:complete len:247 (-) Transcript_50915:211-951(-)
MTSCAACRETIKSGIDSDARVEIVAYQNNGDKFVERPLSWQGRCHVATLKRTYHESCWEALERCRFQRIYYSDANNKAKKITRTTERKDDLLAVEKRIIREALSKSKAEYHDSSETIKIKAERISRFIQASRNRVSRNGAEICTSTRSGHFRGNTEQRLHEKIGKNDETNVLTKKTLRTTRMTLPRTKKKGRWNLFPMNETNVHHCKRIADLQQVKLVETGYCRAIISQNCGNSVPIGDGAAWKIC